MNRKFLLFDHINSIQKEAEYLLKFYCGNDEYLIYYLNENNSNNKQVYVSKLIKNTEGKYFICDISDNEKSRINNIVYNIVIVLPMEARKNNDNNKLIEDFEFKYNVKILFDSINIDVQSYLYNSRVAITSNLLINNCVNFYNLNLHDDHVIDVQNSNFNQIQFDNIVVDNNKLFKNDSNNVQINNDNTINEFSNVNPQMKILGNSLNNIPVHNIVSNDINTSDNNENTNISNSDGFVINASIIIGTIALLLSVTIVMITFIAIKKMII